MTALRLALLSAQMSAPHETKVGASVCTGPGDPIGTHDGAEVSALSTLRLAPLLSLKWLSSLRIGGDL